MTPASLELPLNGLRLDSCLARSETKIENEPWLLSDKLNSEELMCDLWHQISQ